MNGPMLRVAAGTLQAAADELARITQALDGAARDGCGVTILRRTDGSLAGVFINDDVPPGRIDDVPATDWAMYAPPGAA